MNLYFDGEPICVGGCSSPSEIYSTEETRIGTWIDGKPLYRAVYTGVVSLKNSFDYMYISDNWSNKDLIGIRGFLHADKSWGSVLHQYPMPFLDLMQENPLIVYVLSVFKNGDYLQFNHRWNANVTANFTVIAEYTKTTD